MPELPEVETIRRDLSRVLPGQKIRTVKITKSKIVRGAVSSFTKRLHRQVIKQINRRGKLLIFSFQYQDLFLLIHLKMTGQLIYRRGQKTVAGGHGWPLINELPNKYTHAIFSFSDQSKLFFNDMRQFGYLRLVNPAQLKKITDQFGVEPLSHNFTPDLLYRLLHSRATSLKNVLLNQKLVAGLGNIYVDESCFKAGIRPTRKSHFITKQQVNRLYRAIRQVLQQSLRDRGTTFSDYRDGLGGEGKFVRRLRVYGRSGQSCKKCGTTIQKTKIAGRGTAFCPVCQQ